MFEIKKKSGVRPGRIGTTSLSKGQLISKENCQAMNSSKKQTNEFIFTSTYATCFRLFFGRN